jgi:DNA topoisomerase I
MPTGEVQIIVDCRDAAESAGLAYVSTETPGLSRRRSGKGFSYWNADGSRVTETDTLKRIRKLAIPPAWTGVWICPDARGHIQAVGYDDRGRKQYRYHALFREVREGVKFKHMMDFAGALPTLRRRIAADMAKPGVSRDKVLATVVHLLEATMIRVGNASYATQNKSFGLTTLLDRHVKVEGAELKFHFKGKSGKTWRLSVRDRRVARTVKNCQDLPGQHLFQYVDEFGERQAVTSADVNAYLKQISGADITTKDFRTWSGTVLAAMTLGEFEAADNRVRAKKNVTRAIEQVSARLGNTPTICRKCYVHPEIVNAYLDGGLLLEIQKDIDEQLRDEIDTLTPEEAAVLAFLRTRVARDLADEPSATAPPDAERRRPATGPGRRSRSAAHQASIAA